MPAGLLENTTASSEVLETQLSTLSDDPSTWIGEGCASARCVTAVVLAELRRRTRPRPTLRYLRVSKTASCVLFEALGDARRRDPATCGLELWLSGHHEVTRDDVPQNDPVFVTLRDPCERLASLYDHLRRSSPPGHAIHSFRNAAAWGNHLLSSGESIEAWGPPGFTRPQRDYVESGQGGAEAEIACLPTLRRDVNASLRMRRVVASASSRPTTRRRSTAGLDRAHRRRLRRRRNDTRRPALWRQPCAEKSPDVSYK